MPFDGASWGRWDDDPAQGRVGRQRRRFVQVWRVLAWITGGMALFAAAAGFGWR